MVSIYLCFILVFVGASGASPKSVTTDLVFRPAGHKSNKLKSNVEHVKDILQKMMQPSPNILMETIDNMLDTNEIKEYLTNVVDVRISFLTEVIDKTRVPVSLNNKNIEKKTNPVNQHVNILTEIISNGEKIKKVFVNLSDAVILKAILKIMVVAPFDFLMAQDTLIPNKKLDNPDVNSRNGLSKLALGDTSDTEKLEEDNPKFEKELFKQINAVRDEKQKNVLVRQMLFGELSCPRKGKKYIEGHNNDNYEQGPAYGKKPLKALSCGKNNRGCRPWYTIENKIDVRNLIGPVLVKFFTSRRGFINTITNSYMTGVIGVIDKIKNDHILRNISYYFYGDQEKFSDVVRYILDNTTNSSSEDKKSMQELLTINENTIKILKDIENFNLIRQLATHIMASVVNFSFHLINKPAGTPRLKKLYQDIKSGADVKERGNKMFDMLYGHIGCWKKRYGLKNRDKTLNAPEPLLLKFANSGRGRLEWELGIVPYYIDTDSYDSVISERIASSMKAIEDVSCVVFKELPEPPQEEFTWLHFTNPTKEKECVHQVKVGTGGAMNMVLGYNCIQPRHILHSLFHALGFQDEVTHPQRDRYVRILWNNIQPKYHRLFKIRSSSSKPQTEYDVMSVMHFHDRAFSWNGKATILSLVPGMTISPFERMSQLDLMKLRLSYGHQCKKQRASKLFDSCRSVLIPENEANDENPRSEEANEDTPISTSSEEKQSIDTNNLKPDETDTNNLNPVFNKNSDKTDQKDNANLEAEEETDPKDNIPKAEYNEITALGWSSDGQF